MQRCGKGVITGEGKQQESKPSSVTKSRQCKRIKKERAQYKEALRKAEANLTELKQQKNPLPVCDKTSRKLELISENPATQKPNRQSISYRRKGC